MIGTLISANRATLKELSTFYGVKDAYDLLEIVLVDLHNERIVAEWQASRADRS